MPSSVTQETTKRDEKRAREKEAKRARMRDPIFLLQLLLEILHDNRLVNCGEGAIEGIVVA